MRLIKNQLIGSTTEDSQGECLPLGALQDFAAAYCGKRQPLNQGHDLAKPAAGYIENIRVVDHPDVDGEYALIGDIYCDDSRIEEVLGGFSISFLKIIRRSEKEHEVIVYLPYPHYNDESLIRSLSSQAQPVSVGQWIKKASEPTAIGLIGLALIFALTPMWDDYYKTFVAPKIYKFFRENWETFRKRKISADLVQTVEIDGHKIQVLLIPHRGKEEFSFSQTYLEQSMQLVHEFLQSQSQPKEIMRIHLYFHSEDEGYKLHRVEDIHGHVDHHA